MKISLIFASTVLVVFISLAGNAGTVTDDYDVANTTLTATMMNNIKAAVNDNDSNISTNASDIVTNTNNINSIVANAVATAELTSFTLVTNYTDVLSLTINAPAAGYVHVTATGMIQLSGKTNASSSEFASVYVGVTNAANTTPLSSNFTRFYRNGTDGTGSYNIPYSAQGVFPVTEGSNTLYIVGRENGGSGSAGIWYNRLTATFQATQM